MYTVYKPRYSIDVNGRRFRSGYTLYIRTEDLNSAREYLDLVNSKFPGSYLKYEKDALKSVAKYRSIYVRQSITGKKQVHPFFHNGDFPSGRNLVCIKSEKGDRYYIEAKTRSYR